MKDFINTLTGIDKILYRTSYDFELKYSPNATPESAHEAGLKKIRRTEDLKTQMSKPQTYVNLATGKTIKCTESQLISKFS
jgi:hypothetical protein